MTYNCSDFQDFRTESLTTGTSAAFKPPASPQKAWQIASGHFSATSAQAFCIVTAQVCTSLFWWCTATVLMASSELMLSLTRAFVQSRFHALLNCKCQDYCKGNASMAEIPLASFSQQCGFCQCQCCYGWAQSFTTSPWYWVRKTIKKPSLRRLTSKWHPRS